MLREQSRYQSLISLSGLHTRGKKPLTGIHTETGYLKMQGRVDSTLPNQIIKGSGPSLASSNPQHRPSVRSNRLWFLYVSNHQSESFQDLAQFFPQSLSSVLWSISSLEFVTTGRLHCSEIWVIWTELRVRFSVNSTYNRLRHHVFFFCDK